MLYKAEGSKFKMTVEMSQCLCMHRIYNSFDDNWRIVKNVKTNNCYLFYGSTWLVVEPAFKNDYKHGITINFKNYSWKINNFKKLITNCSELNLDKYKELQINCESCNKCIFTYEQLVNINNMYIYSADFYKDLISYLKDIVPNYVEV